MTSRYVVAIDGGTTNTRARVLEDGVAVLASSSVAVGARSTSGCPGGNDNLKHGTAEAVRAACLQAGIKTAEVSRVVASGMITCEAGLLEVPHVLAPAGVDDLAAAAQRMLIPEVWPEPITFVPGVKCMPFENEGHSVPSYEDLSRCDIMRGEESEAFGILRLTGVHGPVLLILPGSHTKFLYVDENDRIVASTTTLAGELASAVATSTLLSRSLESGVGADELDEKGALAGFDTAMRLGLSRALFVVRLLDRIASAPLAARRSFLWGAVIAADVLALEGDPLLGPLLSGRQGAVRLLVGGSAPLRRLFAMLLGHQYKARTGVQVDMLEQNVAERASAVGAALVAQAACALTPGKESCAVNG